MSDSEPRHALQVNVPMLGSGVALLWIGGIVWLCGAAVAATALAQAARKWVAQWDESPSEIARRRMQQFKVAASAGSKAWREQSA